MQSFSKESTFKKENENPTIKIKLVSRKGNNNQQSELDKTIKKDEANEITVFKQEKNDKKIIILYSIII